MFNDFRNYLNIYGRYGFNKQWEPELFEVQLILFHIYSKNKREAEKGHDFRKCDSIGFHVTCYTEAAMTYLQKLGEQVRK